MAAIRDIADFDLDDIIDVLQIFAIFLGDLLELLTFGSIEDVPVMIRFGVGFILGAGWLFVILDFVL